MGIRTENPLKELDITPASPVSVYNLSPPMDEFYASTPESTPEKKSSETSPEPSEIPEASPIVEKPPAMAKSAVSKGNSKVLPDLVPLFEVQASSFGERVRDQEGHSQHLADEMVPSSAGVKATRAFFDNSPSSSPKPKIRSPSPEVMLVDAPRSSTSLVNLAKGKKSQSPNRKGQQNKRNAEEKRSATKRKSDSVEDVSVVPKVSRQEARTKREASNDSRSSKSLNGGTPQLQKGSKSPLSSSEINKLLDEGVKVEETSSQSVDIKRIVRQNKELKTEKSISEKKVTKKVAKGQEKEIVGTSRPNRAGEKRG